MKKRAILRLTTAMALALTLATPAYAATADPALTTQRDQALNALHQDLAATQFKYVLDWPALAIYAAGDAVTGSKWSTADGQNGVTQRALQIQNMKSLTATTTDFESELLALLAAQQNPRNFVRKDYVEAVLASQRADGKFADTIQALGGDLLNAHIYGIIALYAAGVPIQNQELAKQYLLSKQHADGGFDWASDSTASNPDVTAEALVAMKALGLAATDAPVQQALHYLRSLQNAHGGFISQGLEDPDTDAAVIEALLMFGIDPSTFAGGGNSVVSDLLSYQLPDGHFAFTRGGTANPMSTQNGTLALAELVDGEAVYQKLHDEYAGKSSTWTSAFSDLSITASDYRDNMRLVNLGVMAGNPNATYSPDAAVTRDQFAKILVYGLPVDGQNLRDQVGPKITRFQDLPTSAWSNPFVQVAYANHLLVGTSNVTFSPQGAVSGAQLMAVLVRALGLEQQAQAVPNKRTWYDGYVQVAQQQGLCYPGFDPLGAATRTQVAEAFNRFYAAAFALNQ